jgi:hypothetical protein
VGLLGESTVLVLVSEREEFVVKLTSGVERWGCERVGLRRRDRRGLANGRGRSEQHAQQRSSKASKGEKRSCGSRDARRTGSNSKGSRE